MQGMLYSRILVIRERTHDHYASCELLCCKCDHYAVAVMRKAFAHDHYAVTENKGIYSY